MKGPFLFFREHGRITTLFLVVFLSVLMMLMGESRKTTFARSITTTVFNIGRFTFSWAINIKSLKEENRLLRHQNIELARRATQGYNALRENERLRRLLNFKRSYSLGDSIISATVIGHDIDLIANSIIVNVGTSDGIAKNMTVITPEGLVGRVYESYLTSSSVQLLTDEKSRVSVYISGTDLYGFITWHGGRQLILYGLPRQVELPEQAEVYTSGFGVFPVGLLVGTVSSGPLDTVELYASFHVTPAVDISYTREVFILAGSEHSDIWDDGDGLGHFERPEIQ